MSPCTIGVNPPFLDTELVGRDRALCVGTAITQDHHVLCPALVGARADLQDLTGLALPGTGDNGLADQRDSITTGICMPDLPRLCLRQA